MRIRIHGRPSTIYVLWCALVGHRLDVEATGPKVRDEGRKKGKQKKPHETKVKMTTLRKGSKCKRRVIGRG
ncbi:hypothetical protein M413DRAFT_350744 [Hebeloma cylindrosporum]|uniref:Uncharacterized protein n=1 Tax=Hebeloma cylindrosporum TaxID=76867 RepID=A0A0C2XBK2_HEBCY|nr:hypothetical protein M413DRAFT_350744 [Hebeloma cylindrosporum h7]